MTGPSHAEALVRLSSRQMQRPARPESSVWLRRAASAYGFAAPLDHGRGIKAFLDGVLHRLLPQMNFVVDREKTICQSKLRGRIRWPDTFKARSSKGIDPSVFVCQSRRRRFDTPENLVLKAVLMRLHHCLGDIPDPVRNGIVIRRIPGQEVTAHHPERLSNDCSQVDFLLREILRHPELRRIQSPQTLTEEQLGAAEDHPIPEYHAAARYFRRLFHDVSLRPWWLVVHCSQRALLLPLRFDQPEADAWLSLAAAALRETPE